MKQDKVSPQMTADELVRFFGEHCSDEVLTRLFGMDYDFEKVVKRYSVSGIVRKIQRWEAEQEAQKDCTKEK